MAKQQVFLPNGIESPWYTDDSGNLPYAGMVVYLPLALVPGRVFPHRYVRCFHCDTLHLESVDDTDPWPLCKVCLAFHQLPWYGQEPYDVMGRD